MSLTGERHGLLLGRHENATGDYVKGETRWVLKKIKILYHINSSPKTITVLVFHNLLTTNIVYFRNPKSKFRNVLTPL